MKRFNCLIHVVTIQNKMKLALGKGSGNPIIVRGNVHKRRTLNMSSDFVIETDICWGARKRKENNFKFVLIMSDE